MFPKISPVNQDFIWVAEYLDGSYLSEYDFKTREENNFYYIKKDKLLRFGLVGHDMSFFFEAFGGVFKVDGRMFEFFFRRGDSEFPLTGHNFFYNNIISYKDAESVCKSSYRGNVIHFGSYRNDIIRYNFGYSVKFEDIGLNFKVICHIPNGSPMFFSYKLVSENDVEGSLVIKKHYKEIDTFPVSLKGRVGKELNWNIR